MNRKTTLLTAFTLTMLSACSSQPPPSNIGLANPAATYCEAQGGTYDIDSGVCELSDGQRVDGWEFYRSEH